MDGLNNLQVLNNVLADGKEGSYVEKIRYVYRLHGFTERQKKAAELFLFEPTKENAALALKQSPKCWVFVRHFLSSEEITDILIEIISREKPTSSAYMRVLLASDGLKELVEQLLQSSRATNLEHYFKVWDMNQRFRR